MITAVIKIANWLKECRSRARQIDTTKNVVCNIMKVCIQGSFTQTRNRNPDRRAKAPLQMVHMDLAGPVATESIDGYKYVQSFTDDYSGAASVYFLKTKIDTLQAMENILVIYCICSM